MRAHTLGAALGCGLVAFLVGGGEALAHQRPGDERFDYTAYTLQGGEVSLGPQKSAIGIVDEVTLGTYLPTWFAFPVLGAPIPTGFLKLRAPLQGKLALSVRGNFVYVDADVLAAKWTKNSGSSASLFVLPLEVAVSYRLARRYSQSLEATYVAVFAGGDHESDANIRGAATLTNLTLSTLSEWRLSRVVALTLLTRVMVYRGNARVKTHFSQGSTTVDADLGASKPYQGLVACAVPGVSFSFAHIDFQLGLGYGNWWLPVVQLALPDWGLVPEVDFSVRF